LEGLMDDETTMAVLWITVCVLIAILGGVLAA
jgi:hypothetical protein